MSLENFTTRGHLDAVDAVVSFDILAPATAAEYAELFFFYALPGTWSDCASSPSSCHQSRTILTILFYDTLFDERFRYAASPHAHFFPLTTALPYLTMQE